MYLYICMFISLYKKGYVKPIRGHMNMFYYIPYLKKSAVPLDVNDHVDDKMYGTGLFFVIAGLNI